MYSTCIHKRAGVIREIREIEVLVGVSVIVHCTERGRDVPWSWWLLE